MRNRLTIKKKSTDMLMKEEKELLKKVLCEQLPYGVQVEIEGYHSGILKGIDGDTISTDRGINYPLRLVKPYLRPLSSMTKEEKEELLTLLVGEDAIGYFQVEGNEITNTDEKIQFSPNWQYHWLNFSNENILLYVDWLNARHFDYRSLIEMGLAIAAVGENNPYK